MHYNGPKNKNLGKFFTRGAVWQNVKVMAERQGFEPWDQFPGQLLSRQLQSATLPPLLTKALLLPNIFRKRRCVVQTSLIKNPGKFAHLSTTN